MTTSRLSHAVATGVLLSILAGCGGPTTGTTSPPSAGASQPVAPPSTAPITESVTTPPPTEAAALAALPAKLRSRVPRFAPPPAPTKVTLPKGDKAPNFTRIPTTEKIAFITIDDGWEKNPLALQLFQAANVPVTLFLEVDAVKSDPGYFIPMQAAGVTIQNHTISHPTMTRLSYEGQKRQICGGADRLAKLFGPRPTLFRPPGGAFNGTTLRAAKACGMKASFTWTQTTDHGIVFFQGPTRVVQPGDIILMHFRPRFVDDFLAVLNAIDKAGLTPARLEDYIP
ncbi:polysaccharide deacetylase family protein [Actinoplanes regularis]|uniref:polysaccharide deacetylase family protein n=1 Tax=Actinoplanes regularis TaxID=52697 RepID=UPI0025531891|nr:polysaccharide deacetylase family protein [Actinoplanes regularis]